MSMSRKPNIGARASIYRRQAIGARADTSTGAHAGMGRILIVEDDDDIATSLESWLSFERHHVEKVGDGREALGYLKGAPYDLVVLDIELPGLSGFEVCRQYRSTGGKAPVLMLTGRSDITDKTTGFDAGADDYLTKPFHPQEFSARVRALLRRPAEFSGNVLRAANLVLDPGQYRVQKDGREIELLPMEFALLEFFMRHPNQVFPPEALLDRVWPPNSDSSIDAVRTVIKTLRKKIDDGETSLIKNVHGVGYRWDQG